MTALTPADRARIEAVVRRGASYDARLTEDQVMAAVGMATSLYSAAAAHGLTPLDADDVTSFPNAALDGVRSRHWQQRSYAELGERLGQAIEDPIGVMSDYDNSERVVIGVEPADLAALIHLAGIELPSGSADTGSMPK